MGDDRVKTFHLGTQIKKQGINSEQGLHLAEFESTQL